MGNVTSLSQALTMSLTSTSSESDNDFLETCRASTLLAELEDDDELPEPDDDDDENEDENEEDEDYDDVMVMTRNLPLHVRTCCTIKQNFIISFTYFAKYLNLQFSNGNII